jgi:hypothetical protein
MSMTEQTQETKPKLTQKDYNQKWLSSLTPERRKEYFRQKARIKRGWKCSRCNKPLDNDIGYKPLGTKDKLCETCTTQEIIQRHKEKTT